MREFEPPIFTRPGEVRDDTTVPPRQPDDLGEALPEPHPEALEGVEGKGERSRLWTVLPLLLAVVAIGLAAKLFADSQGSQSVALPGAVTSPYKFTAGTPAPDFSLQSVDGGSVSLADFRGKTLVVNFWATWCPPCRSEMPDMEQVYTERKDDVVVLAVNVQEARAPVRDFADKYRLSFPILMDTAGEVTQSFGVQSLPTTFFIDKEGKVASFNMGALNKSAIGRKLEQIPQ